MVKADIKHNYYADLDLPQTCSIDDIKKQYRKLALQYHPDRNAGKEDEYVPKFQAIQTAHEILGDPATKTKYDSDRRVSGKTPLYSAQSFRASQPAPGNPYSANTAYPPPPRRTQPGKWQRPQPYAAQGQTPNPSQGGPTGADRFTNFPRTAPTARKDPAQDRSNMFRAWQNMNNAQERQQRFTPGTAPPPQTSPTGTRPPPPPPRNETRMPSEEEIRAGMNHRKAPPQFDASRADQKQSAWAAFQQANPGKTGKANVNRARTTKTPKKAGFDPNMPGSDERPAGTGAYANRNKSADFGRPYPPPPPPPGPPPRSPLSPLSPGDRRGMGDPLRQFKSREDPTGQSSDRDRLRTPYRSVSGEKTPFSSDGLRRSASTRDTTKLNPGGSANRARSTSPLSQSRKASQPAQKPFVDYSSSEESSDDVDTTHTSDEFEDRSAPNSRPGTAPHGAPTERPKAVPTPPSRRMNGSQHAYNVPPTGRTNSGLSDGDRAPSKPKANMYDYSSTSYHPDSPTRVSPFDAFKWQESMFGANSTFDTQNRAKIKIQLPAWAVPSSIAPGGVKKEKKPPPSRRRSPLRGSPPRMATLSSPLTTAANGKPPPRRPSFPRNYRNASDEDSFRYFQSQLMDANSRARKIDPGDSRAQAARETIYAHDYCLDYLTLEVFYGFVSQARLFGKFNFPGMQDIMAGTLIRFPMTGNFEDHADSSLNTRFTFPVDHDTFSPNTAKSRSEENINTTFSPDGWNGKFTGSADYFAHQGSNNKTASSPQDHRTGKEHGLRSSRSHESPATETPGDMPPPPRPAGSDQANSNPNSGNGEVKFSQQQWEQTFQDASWSWPPPPPNPPKSSAKGKGPVRKNTRANRANAPSEYAPEEEYGNEGSGDAMDIDPAPSKAKDAKTQYVPTTEWHRQQQKQYAAGRKASAASGQSDGANFATSLDDLANVEPMGRSGDGAGLKNLDDLASTMPFASQPSSGAPNHPQEAQRLQMPPVPKAPEPPTKLTAQSWQTFVRAFGAYVQAFHVCNNTMLQHFQAREQQAQNRMVGGMGWLEYSGDTTGVLGGIRMGFGSYLQSLKEDEQARMMWNVASERHVEACTGFEKVRDRVKRLVASGGLADH